MQTLAPVQSSETATASGSSYDVAPLGLDTVVPSETIEIVDRETLFRDFAPLVRRLIMHYGGTPDLREELVGEIYCRFSALYDVFDPQRGITDPSLYGAPAKAHRFTLLSARIADLPGVKWQHSSRVSMRSTRICVSTQPIRGTINSCWIRSLAFSQPHWANCPIVSRKWSFGATFMAGPSKRSPSISDIQPATSRSLLRHGLNNLRKYFAEFHIATD